MINLGVQVSICSDWHFESYSLDRLLWHMTNANERQIIDWYKLPISHCLQRDCDPALSVCWELRRVQAPARVWSRSSTTMLVWYRKHSSCGWRCMHRCISSSRGGLSCFLTSSSWQLIDSMHGMLGRRIHSTSMDPAMAQRNIDQHGFDGDFLQYLPEELIEQPNNSFNHLTSFVAATEASKQFAAVPPMGGSAIASSSQPIPCSNSNSNSNDIINITYITRDENMGLLNWSTIVEVMMSLGGQEWCQWSDFGLPLCATLFLVLSI